MDRQFIVVKELDGDLSNVSVQTAEQLESQQLSAKRLVLWETKQPQRLMARIYGVYRKSHMSGSMFAVSFDELFAFMKTDRSAQSLIVQSSKSSASKILIGVLCGCVAGVAVLAYITWGVMAAMAMGVLATIVLGKR